ncbi:HIT family protein [Gordonia zhaorongruii]|uniref:HIT family protein n=1 Tax=Gordonia zhaorongruii TaxID=2597659 RepID=UPI00104EF068|nr:HIT family protein [Gordonia zhaorongruii]
MSTAGDSPTGCVFCDIVSETSPAHVVYSDDDVIAFLDISPVARGHTLVIPRRHSAGLDDVDPALGAPLLAAAQRVAKALKGSAFRAHGVNVALNDGRAAMQTVFHTHIHVIPRRHGDKVSFAKGLLTRRSGDLAAIGTELRAEIAAQR